MIKINDNNKKNITYQGSSILIESEIIGLPGKLDCDNF